MCVCVVCSSCRCGGVWCGSFMYRKITKTIQLLAESLHVTAVSCCFRTLDSAVCCVCVCVCMRVCVCVCLCVCVGVVGALSIVLKRSLKMGTHSSLLLFTQYSNMSYLNLLAMCLNVICSYQCIADCILSITHPHQSVPKPPR